MVHSKEENKVAETVTEKTGIRLSRNNSNMVKELEEIWTKN